MKINEKQTSKSNEIQGKIINQAEKTTIVEIRKQVKHIKYGKIQNMAFKYMAHNPNNKYKIGDVVTIKPCRPYSRKKKWIISQLIHESV